MKHTFVIAGIAALAISAPVLAQSSPSLAAVSAEPAVTPGIVLAQALVPAPAPAIVATPAPGAAVVIAPSAPPPPQVEAPPPPPAPSYVWEPGHWAWNGAQFNWEVGKYVQKPTATATYVPGHWQQYSDGWGWVPGEWNYQGVGSSTPPQ